ncbi:Carboxylesterase NlhH [Poriferisphaera corsica]|uniref:Carboxylesterase NlhH n=1 Tax=Poriferisphaera corsica TaxID=2528020 RepID=A0A517YUH1_9BACT|nr:alpha/beta hydrolase [Poriferisphaera corsica]QDU33856.1 Carboxylesterase NlhH [Poriferisphaera corsica]
MTSFKLIFACILFCIFMLCIPASAADEPIKYTTKSDIFYPTDENPTDYQTQLCRLDIYYPTNKTNFPTVIWLHSGGLYTGNKYIPGELTNKGFAVVAVNYRLHPKVKAPVYIEDAAAAVAWVFNNITQYGGNPDKIYLSGASAGGYLTSMIGLDKRWLAKHSIDANRLAALIPITGQAITHFTIRKERGIPNTQPLIDDLAPLFHVRKDAPPMLLITGDRDLELFGRYEENAYLHRMMKIAGHTQTKLIEQEYCNHGQVVPPSFPFMIRFINELEQSAAQHTKLQNE